jgi:hypothetical protein
MTVVAGPAALAAGVSCNTSDCVLLGLFLAGRRASTPWSRRGVAALGRLARVGWRAGSRRPTLRPAAGRACPPPSRRRRTDGDRRCGRRPAALALHRRRTAAAPPPSQNRRRFDSDSQNGRAESGHWHRRHCALGGGRQGRKAWGGGAGGPVVCGGDGADRAAAAAGAAAVPRWRLAQGSRRKRGWGTVGPRRGGNTGPETGVSKRA